MMKCEQNIIIANYVASSLPEQQQDDYLMMMVIAITNLLKVILGLPYNKNTISLVKVSLEKERKAE